MNIFLYYEEKFLKCIVDIEKSKKILLPKDFKKIVVEIPPIQYHADVSCNAALLLAKFNKTSPIKLGEILKKSFLLNFSEIDKIELTKNGFLNINFKKYFWESFLDNVLKSKKTFGSNNNKKEKYLIEFVSANPTGPLHVGHCRGAIFGDVLSNLLKFNGNEVTKEYYVNDYGSQIKNFVHSVFYRIIEITNNKKFPMSKDLYPGDYIIDIAKKIIQQKKIKDFSNINKIFETLTSESLKHSIEIIKNNLNLIGVKHDSFVNESDLIKKNLVSSTIKQLEINNFIYKGELKPPKGQQDEDWEKRTQLLFRSTEFGDDVDRALQKEDGSWTYFASDIAYHADKVNRQYDYLINVLGADHAGYTKRIVAATKAISKNKSNLICKVSQLVKLFKNNQPFKMSKRAGNYITVDDLVHEVGKDSVRFMMLNRSNDVELDFDFQQVTEKSKENPVYYIQYAYARINSIFKNSQLDINKKIEIKNFTLNDHEINILKKISQWPQCIKMSTNKLEPHRIPFYLYELSTLFHSYWNMGKMNSELRFISDDGKPNYSRLSLLQAITIVIQNGMLILGVSTPKNM